MNRPVTAMLVIGILAVPSAQAGVVMDMVSKDMSGQETDRMKFYVQSGQVRMDNDGRRQREKASMIFLGEEFLLVDHHGKSYIVMDRAMLEKVGTQVSAAMKEMEAQLAGMPPEQRAMVEQMMKGRMQGMMPDAEAPPPPRVVAGGAGEWGDYDCRNYTVFDGNQKTQEICAAPLDDIAGADELMQAFRGMARYIQKMRESMPGPLAAGMANNPAGFMDQIDGFPVHAIIYRGGAVLEETSLESMVEEDLDAALFRAPDGYTRSDPLRGR